MPKFSICIPNYNYEQYVGLTIGSVLGQSCQDFEILVADNASTDRSVEIVQGFDDPRIRLSVNRCNVGFAGNIDRAHHGAMGDHLMLVSSDDLVGPGALAAYAAVLDAQGGAARRTLLYSDCDQIDADGDVTGARECDPRLWAGAKEDERLSRAAGAPVLRMPAAALLRASLRLMRSPGPWLTFCYPRELYEAVEGYGGGRLFGPDKFFAWKALSVAEDALLIRSRLFQYRYHSANQDAQQAATGTLKHLTDQYINSFDTPPEVLAAAGLTRGDMAEAFIEQDIALRGLKLLATGRAAEARRGLGFGRAAYPAVAARNRKLKALGGLLALGPGGQAIARRLYHRQLRRWTDAQVEAAGRA